MKLTPQTISFCVPQEDLIVTCFREAIQELNGAQKTTFINGQLYHDLLTAFTEGVGNAIRHAHELKKKGPVQCSLLLNSRQITLRIEDHGLGYNLKRVPRPRFNSLTESGRGIFMIRQLMDEVDYKKGKNKNTLVLKRNLVGFNQESRDLDLLYEISNAILESPDIRSIYKIILDKMVDVFGVERASILTHDRISNRLKVIASRGLNPKLDRELAVKPGEGISGFVFQHAKPCLIENMERNLAGWRKKKRYKSQSFISAPMICSPMRLGQETIGVINMTDRVDGKPFTKRDLRLLTTIANQVTAYLHICQLFNQAKDAKLFRKEMEIARQIQQGYLASNPPRLNGLELAGWCDTAQTVGGDYYDFIRKDNDNLYIVIADVSGHNLGAAMTMINFRSQLKALISTESNPGKILEQLNRNLFEDLSRNDQFISVILARILSQSGKIDKIEIANAGHPIPLIINHSGVSPFSKLQDSGTALGALSNEVYPTQSFSLEKGNSLFLYTDGLIETVNARKERYGFLHLLELLKKQGNLSAERVIEATQQELHQFRGTTPLSDDVTAVVLRTH